MPRITEAQLAEWQQSLAFWESHKGDSRYQWAYVEFCRATVTLAPTLVAEVRRLRGVIERAEQTYAEWGGDWPELAQAVHEILQEADDAGN